VVKKWLPPTVLQLKEIEPPRELVAALSADFLGRLNIAKPPPVQLSTLENWTGYCHSQDTTDRGEVIISDWRTPPPAWRITQGIRGTYVHETAHRQIWQAEPSADTHGLEFFTLLLFLLRRAGERKGGWSWILNADLYDCQNCIEPQGVPGIPSLGENIDFSMKLALELAEQEITAEQAAEEICRRAAGWKAWRAEESARREAAQKATREKTEVLRSSLQAARDKIFWWRYCSVMLAVSGFLAGAIFY
jgi:hypothetical protein